MPHVLTLVEQFWHRVPGGTAKATEKTLSALAAENEFTLTGVAAWHARREGPARRIPASCRTIYHRLPRPVLYETWMRTELAALERRHHPGGSVFWASSLIVPPTPMPVVATVNDLDFINYPQFLTRRGRSFFPRMWNAARRRASRFVVPSQAVADDCHTHGIDPELVTVIPYGVDQPECRAEDASVALADLNLPERFVLLVAPLGLRKNPVRLAQALGPLDCDVVAVGGIEDSPGARSAFGALGHRLRVLGVVDDHTLSALYHRASLLLYPSVAEGFGLPVLEAMAHGTPVVTSAGTATEEVAGGAAVLVDPLSVGNITEAVEAVLGDGDLGRRLRRLGLDRAAEMTWAHTGRRYGQLLGQAASDQ